MSKNILLDIDLILDTQRDVQLDTIVETLFGQPAEPKQGRFRGNVHAVLNETVICECYEGDIPKVDIFGWVYSAEARWYTIGYRAGLEGKSWKEVICGYNLSVSELDNLFEQYTEGKCEAQRIRWEA